VARKANPARLVIALLVAAVLAVFLLYTSIAGGGNPSLAPSELAGRAGEQVQLAGVVVGPAVGDSHAAGLRFRLRDIGGKSPSSVSILYRGSVPDLFKPGRHIVLDGRLRKGTFVAEPGSMITKCPSKYVPEQSGNSS
jgi:cytochrome c-type biogenesis protein CcmE